MLFREHNHSYIITPLSRRRFIPHLPRPADYTSYKNDYCNNYFEDPVPDYIDCFRK